MRAERHGDRAEDSADARTGQKSQNALYDVRQLGQHNVIRLYTKMPEGARHGFNALINIVEGQLLRGIPNQLHTVGCVRQRNLIASGLNSLFQQCGNSGLFPPALGHIFVQARLRRYLHFIPPICA